MHILQKGAGKQVFFGAKQCQHLVTKTNIHSKCQCWQLRSRTEEQHIHKQTYVHTNELSPKDTNALQNMTSSYNEETTFFAKEAG